MVISNLKPAYGAAVKHDFGNGFHLDEERIRKIHEIIRIRVADLNPVPSLTFRVHRGSDAYYDTTLVEDVLNEKNGGLYKIHRLEIFFDGNPEFKLQFSSEEGVDLIIRGSDRDWVFLLFSDLRQYLTSEVMASKFGPRLFQYRWAIISIFYLAFAAAMFAVIFPSLYPTVEKVQTAVDSQDVSVKLNLMLEWLKPKPPSYTFYAQILPIIMMFGVSWILFAVREDGPIPRFIRLMSPYDIFIIGNEKEQLVRREALRQRIFWGVVISFIVGCVSSLVIWFVTQH